MPPALPVLRSPQVTTVLPGRSAHAAHSSSAGEALTTRPAVVAATPSAASPGGSPTPPPTTVEAAPEEVPSAEGKHGPGHSEGDARWASAGAADQRVVQVQDVDDAHRMIALDDPLLSLAAASLDDLERTRIAAENRLRQLTRDEPDKDGEERGFGLPDTDPQVRAQGIVLEGLKALEHGAELALVRRLRKHALWPWIQGTIGVGPKQGARLLAAIGDPYWNTLYDRPRTVSELWAYSGYKVVPAGRTGSDAHLASASGPQDIPADRRTGATHCDPVGGEQSDGDPGHAANEAHALVAGVAVRRKKGQKSNWSAVAKMRAYLIAESCIKQARSPYRAVYDQRRAHTALTHPDWTLGHSHNDALRVVAKRVLRDLWIAAREVHGEAS